MKAKFTKGEWIVEKDDSFYAVTQGTYCVCTSFAQPEDEANAHLIAAAPLMYEELKICKGMMDAFFFNTGSLGARSQAESIDQLLKTARGEK